MNFSVVVDWQLAFIILLMELLDVIVIYILIISSLAFPACWTLSWIPAIPVNFDFQSLNVTSSPVSLKVVFIVLWCQVTPCGLAGLNRVALCEMKKQQKKNVALRLYLTPVAHKRTYRPTGTHLDTHAHTHIYIWGAHGKSEVLKEQPSGHGFQPWLHVAIVKI